MTAPPSEEESGGERVPGIVFRIDGIADMGPGRADLLDAVDATGSISGAARSVGMSYRKAWRLIDQMNHAFRQPVVDTTFGGAGGGGARLTDTGRAIAQAYRSMERKLAEATREEAGLLRRLAAPSISN